MGHKTKKQLMPISVKDLAKLIGTIEKLRFYQDFLDKRNSCMLVFAFTLGLRPLEYLDAKINYLDVANKRFYIPSSSNKQRYQDWKTIPEFMLDILYDYLEIRKKIFPKSEWLFPSKCKPGRLSVSGWDRIFRTLLKEAGLYQVAYIDGNNNKHGSLTPYSLRAGGARVVGKKLRNVLDLAIWLRQKDRSLRTALKYYYDALSEAEEPRISEQVWGNYSNKKNRMMKNDIL